MSECYGKSKRWLTGRGPAIPEPAERYLGMNVHMSDQVRLTKSSDRDGLGVDSLSNKSSEGEGNGELEHVTFNMLGNWSSKKL